MITLSASGEAAWQSLRQHIEWTPGFWLAWIFTNHAPSGRELFERAADQLRGLGRSAVVRRPEAPAELAELLVWLFDGANATDGCVAIEVVQSSDEWAAAYRSFLLRLNERRERLRRSLSCGLVVVVPTLLKSATSAEAPDLWSIRSLALDIAPPPAKRHDTGDFNNHGDDQEPLDASPVELRLADQAVAAAQRAGNFESEVAARLRRARALLSAGRVLEAREEASRVVELAPTTQLSVQALETLGSIDAKIGDRVAAERHYQAAVEQGPTLVTDKTLHDLASLLGRRGAFDQALPHAQAALARRRARRKERPTAEALRDEAISLRRVGDLLQYQGDLPAALMHYEESLALAERVRTMTGDTPQALRDEFLILLRVGDILHAQGVLTVALVHYQRGLDLARHVRTVVGDSPATLRDESRLLGRVGDILGIQSDLATGLALQEERLGLVRRVRAMTSDDPDALREEAECLRQIGDILQLQGNLSRALAVAQESLELYRRLRAVTGDAPQTLRDMASALHLVGTTLSRLRERTRAREALEESLELRRRLRARLGDTRATLRSESLALARLADVLIASGDFSAALAMYRESLELHRRIRTLTGDPREGLVREAHLLRTIGEVLRPTGDPSYLQYFAESDALLGRSRVLDGDGPRGTHEAPVSLNLGEVLSAALAHRQADGGGTSPESSTDESKPDD